MDMLKRMGCSHAQGFLVDEPLEPGTFAEKYVNVRSRRTNPRHRPT